MATGRREPLPPASPILAARTDRWTEILFRARSARAAKRWRFVSFRGKGGKEWRGVVDVIGSDVTRIGDVFLPALHRHVLPQPFRLVWFDARAAEPFSQQATRG